jgi:elongation factor P
VVSVIASNIRKGNVVEKDGKLYVVLTAENIHPGKGTPVTQLEMRRISDGVKVNERYKTTDTLEKAFIDERTHTYLYHDGDHYILMDPETFDQVSVSESIIGDATPFLVENMEVRLSLFNGTPIAIELPARVTLEVSETEPVVKGQTASGSFKPATLSTARRHGATTWRGGHTPTAPTSSVPRTDLLPTSWPPAVRRLRSRRRRETQS